MKSTEEFIQDLFAARRAISGKKAGGMSPPQRLVLSFAIIVAIGTILLLLPWSTPADQPIAWVDALFTATSAVCVTGLIVRDTATSFTPFGQTVIVLLFKVGGLGYMILATSAAILLGRKMGVHERATIKQALNLDTTEGMGRFVRNVIFVSLGAELIGTIVITLSFLGDHTLGRSLALGAFHAISGFNNAGFCLFTDNLMGEGGNPVVVITILLLALMGGLGFFVFHEFIYILRGKRKKISIHTKIVLITTISLTILGAIGLYFTADMNWGQAFFLSSVARTAGFNIQDTGALAFRSQMLMIPLMFIGASPGGTGGGIKTTTFAVVIMAIWSTLRGRNEVTAFHRRITSETIYKALMVFVVMSCMLVGLTLTIELLENRSIGLVLFEMASALGTVGLSMGDGGNLSLSALFSTPGKVLVVITMFIGRLGPLTLGLAAAFQSAHPQVKYPEGRVSIG
jgi:trk/ktr system potassium uptake protein